MTEKKKHGPGAHAVHVDGEAKAANLKRLARIEGQVRGIARMVDDERWCADVLTQIASVQQALRGLSKELLRGHLGHCAAKGLAEGGAARERTIEEILELVTLHGGGR